MQYVNSTKDYGITLGLGPIPKLLNYTDAAHSNTFQDWKSISGTIHFCGQSPIMWSSKKQSLVTTSTMESELVALSATTPPVLWLRDLIRFLYQIPYELPYAATVIMQDNQGTIHHARNHQITMRTAHLQRRNWFMRQHLDKDFELQYCPTEQMLADGLTKV